MASRQEAHHPIVVTGATGVIGRRVVAGLLDADRPARGVSRYPHCAMLPDGADTIFGDLRAPSTLRNTFRGAAQLLLIAIPETIEAVVVQAKRGGIEQVVVVSSAAVTAGYDTTYNAIVERAVMDSGLDWSIVRPGEFATNSLLIWGPAIRADRRAVEPFLTRSGIPCMKPTSPMSSWRTCSTLNAAAGSTRSSDRTASPNANRSQRSPRR